MTGRIVVKVQATSIDEFRRRSRIGVGTVRRLGVATDLAATVGYALLTPYLVLALKRVYSESTGAILLKAGTLIALTVFLKWVANVVAIRLTLALA